jgi:hypothetical protein
VTFRCTLGDELEEGGVRNATLSIGDHERLSCFARHAYRNATGTTSVWV